MPQAAVCSSLRTSPRETRVECQGILSTGRRCGLHRILEHSAKCFSCGSFAYARVKPTLGDVPAIYADLVVLLGELVDVVPSPEVLAVVARVSELQVAYLRTLPESDPTERSA